MGAVGKSSNEANEANSLAKRTMFQQATLNLAKKDLKNAKTDKEKATAQKRIDKATKELEKLKEKRVEKAVKENFKTAKQWQQEDFKQAVNKLKNPDKFKSTKTTIDGDNNDRLTLSIENMGNRGYQASINIKGGGRFDSAQGLTYTQAKKALNELFDRYKKRANRFKGRKLSKSEMRDLSSGL